MSKTQQVTLNKERLQQGQHANELQHAGGAELQAKVEKWLCNVTGMESTEVAEHLWGQMQRMLVCGADLPYNQQLYLAFQMIVELKPANATEALLAVQMFSVHEAALVFLKEATRTESEDGCDRNVLRTTRLMRLFREQLEAMGKLKGRATQQKVTVEHVHVHAGAQAVVGVVKASEGESERG